MKVAFYIGDHHADTLVVRAGWWITRATQAGPYRCVTHCEAIHAENSDGSVMIASSSIRDGGVRSKQIALSLGSWLIADMQGWDVQKSIELLEKTRGQPYDWRGAIATRFPSTPQAGAWFCNEWVAEPYLQASSSFGPHHLAAICMSAGRDGTHSFFWDRE